MAYWLTRDEKDTTVSTYDFWRGKPVKFTRWWESNDAKCENLFSVYPRTFRMLFKTHLKPGEIRKVKSIKIELS